MELNPYALSLILLTPIPLAIAIYSIRQHRTPGAPQFALLMLASVVWMFAYGLELSSLTLKGMLWWLKIEYLGIASLPAIWIGFILHYASYHHALRLRNLVVFFSVPVISLLLVWTNEWHSLFFSSVSLETSGPFPLLVLTWGPWCWVHMIYFYLALLMGVVLLIRVYLYSSRLYRNQILFILLGTFAPWGANLAYVAGIRPFLQLDLTPYAFTVTGLAAGWGLFRYRLFDLVPVAQEKVIVSMLDSVITLDLQSRVIDFNPAAERLLGKPLEHFLGRPITEFLTNQPELIATYGEVYDAHTQVNIRMSLTGEVHCYEMTISPLSDQQGGLTGRVVVLHDITELMRVEAELRRAKEEAEAANRAKSLFLANMSHELRTPLNAVIGFSQLMVRDPSLTAVQRQNLTLINRSGEHLLQLINEVLDLAKIEAGRMILQEQDFDLNFLLNDLYELFSIPARSKGLTLTAECLPDVPRFLYGDERKLRQILINLVGNAIKFTDRGSVTLRTRRTVQEIAETPFLYLTFEVTDTGCGFNAEDLPRIFQAFMQGPGGEKPQEGTGLGLTISRQFAWLMGGELHGQSAGVGQGATFVLDLPFRLAEKEPESILPVQSRRALHLQPDQPAFRLLVVEDQEANRLLLVSLLTGLGFEVRTAVDGQEAVRQWQEWHPHLIWMDVRMPVMDGREATRQIRAQIDPETEVLLPGGNRTPVIIALTASALEEDRMQILAGGCDDFVRKPFREREIVGRLETYLGAQFVYEAAARDDPVPEAGPAVGERHPWPQEWLRKLDQAALEGDILHLQALADQIRSQNPSLAAQLALWADAFDYDRIRAFVERHQS